LESAGAPPPPQGGGGVGLADP